MPGLPQQDSAKLISTASLLRRSSRIGSETAWSTVAAYDQTGAPLFCRGKVGLTAPCPPGYTGIGQTPESEIATLGVVVPFEEARDPAESLQPLLDIVAEDMQAVNRIILDKAVSDVELIPELAHHLIDSGGKRLRPMLTHRRRQAVRLSAATATSALAAAVEFMHTATLLHDDVVDESGYAARQDRRRACSGATRRACWSATSCSARRSA